LIEKLTFFFDCVLIFVFSTSRCRGKARGHIWAWH